MPQMCSATALMTVRHTLTYQKAQAQCHTNTSGIFKGFYKDTKTGRGKFGGDGENEGIESKVEFGNKLSEHQQKYHEKTKIRDLALLTLMLGTGIRVSECVGLDITDVDFDYDRIKIVRKGGYESYVYFGQEARESLIQYLREREEILPVAGHENALFLSSQRKRISVRSVENLVKKYAQITTPLKKITPHKLRSTYGTNLYQQTSDIYLVADVLGHKDVNTTKKHYADIDERQRMRAKDAVTLRERIDPK